MTIRGLIVSVRHLRGLCLLAGVLAAPACNRPLTVVQPRSSAALPSRSSPDPIERRASAERLVRSGCLDCLVEAYRELDQLRADSAAADPYATMAVVRAGALIALRERELGLVDSGYLAKVRELTRTIEPEPTSLLQLLDIAEALPYGSPAARAPAIAERRTVLQVSRDWMNGAEAPAGLAAHQELFGYVWLALACEGASAGAIRPDNARDGLGAMREFPLLRFKFATACDRRNPAVLSDLLAENPRFIELNYHLGLAALGGQTRRDLPGRPDLEEADARLRRAYDWRPDWPALTVMLGNIATTAEDFAGALEFYRQTLALVPEQPDALIGAVRSLTSLERHEEAIATADMLIASGRYPGDARYWRALNEVHLSRFDDAWADIELATTLLVNADVPKLSGIIAINRQSFDVARQKLEEAETRRENDCEVGFYLQIALSEQRAWPEAAETAGRAAACFDQDEAQLLEEIDDLRASETPEAKRERLIASRTLRLSANDRMRAACWFNAAAAYFNVGSLDRARVYAEKLLEDERFGDRARNLVSRLGPAR